MAELTEAAPELDIDVCVHRWMLESPVGEVTHGTCKLCGQLRDFTDKRPSASFYSRTPRIR
jgi:hypothetical protein